jgi:Alw26I/Eco31I/Esp3I family type II restriction m6 adenine DNA methyltransferase
MIELQIQDVRQGVNKAYLKIHENRADLDLFKQKASAYLKNLSEAERTNEDEEHRKAYLRDFLKEAFYQKEDQLVNTSKDVDLSIYSGKTTSSTVEVLVETKLTGNRSEMITKDNLDAKSFYQILHYYFEERENGNEDLKHLVITDYKEFFFFDAQEIERHFYSNKSLVNAFRDWETKQKVSSNKPFMYSKFSDFIKNSDLTLSGIHVDLSDYDNQLKAPASEKDEELIPLFKLFSPEHLVKKPFANDSNSLDKGFYNELLHILGLQEVKKKGNRLIQRLPKEERHRGSLIENTIEILRYDQHMNEVREATVHYGEEEDDQLFGVALELVITWMNRVLFLKLMESQLLAYHNQDEHFKFLRFDIIDEYDELNKLFFRVLALRNEERPSSIQERFGHIPYLNSSLFDSTDLEKTTIQISGLDDKATLNLHSRSVLKKGNKPPEEPLNTLDYLLRFLEAYNFSAESFGGIQTEDKTLINASVLGLIFEKINGYKDGSFFTPGFITEYMAKETLRKAVVDKFVEEFPGLFPSPLRPSPQGRGVGGEGQYPDVVRGMSAITPAKKLPESLIQNARHLRKNQTEAEELLWQLLRKRQLHDLKFRRQHPVEEGFVLDFYCHEVKLAVELDGGYHQEEQQKMSDEEREQFLRGIGIRVLRFANTDVIEEPEQVLEAIANGANQQRNEIENEHSQAQVESNNEDLWEHLKNRIGRDIPIKKANELINSITICDPAVGSGHFLVSCLNELIAIKSDLKMLCDRNGSFIPHLEVTVENDELAVEYSGKFFEYNLHHNWTNGEIERKPAGSDVQKIQEALFHEKKYLIENCLFGVDINPNSVKICRLRLWIELLKHAYYRRDEDYSELEVLPNIDINIKQGNSLVSRFELDEDLSSIFKKSEHSLDDYKEAVRTYRETRDLTEKNRLQKLIDDIKNEFTVGLKELHPERVKLKEYRAELHKLSTQFDMFGDEIEGEAGSRRAKIKKAEEDLEKQQKKVAELESGKLYRQAFEWRFEFSETLDNEGEFIGFDIIIGNPPYDVLEKNRNEPLKPYADLRKYLEKTGRYEVVEGGKLNIYRLFIKLFFELSKLKSRVSFITQLSLIADTSVSNTRKYLFDRSSDILFDCFPQKDDPQKRVFEEAKVSTVITQAVVFPEQSSKAICRVYPFNSFEDNHKEFKFTFSELELLDEKNLPIPLVNKSEWELLKKLYSDEVVQKFRDVEEIITRRGEINLSTFKKYITENNDHKKLLRGAEIAQYMLRSKLSQGDFKWFNEDLLHKESKPKDIINNRRIALQRITGVDEKLRLVGTIVEKDIYFSGSTNSVHIEGDTDLTLEYILGLLNSRLYQWRFKLTSTNNNVGTNEIDVLPIVEKQKNDTDFNLIESISSTVTAIIKAKKEKPDADTSELEAKIDELVYELYGLTDEEIAIVEESVV